MAKKIATRKPTRKPAPKTRAKAKAKPKARAASLKPAPVTSGKGPTPAEIGADLVALFNAGREADARHKWWHKNIESIEGQGVNMVWRGWDAVEGKNAWWDSQNEVLGASAEGPYVGATGFAVKFRMEIAERATGKRSLMTEIGVYTVRDGKIIREEFMYAPSPSAGA